MFSSINTKKEKEKEKMKLKKLSILAMGIVYIWVGISHFYNTEFFLKIMPPSFPFHLASVYISGFFEIVFGFGILFQSTRKYAAWGLIFLLIAVYPANIYLAFSLAKMKLEFQAVAFK